MPSLSKAQVESISGDAGSENDTLQPEHDPSAPRYSLLAFHAPPVNVI